MMYEDDRNLMTEDIKAGIEEAYEYLFKVYYPRLKNYVLHYLKDDELAEDVLQNSMIKLFENRRRIKSQDAAAFLFIIVRNECLNELKVINKKRQYTEEINDYKEIENLYNTNLINDPAHRMLYQELDSILNNAIERLPHKAKVIYMMSRIEGKTNKEIAAAMNLSIKAVEKHITQSNKTLRQLLIKEGYFALLLALLNQ